MISQMLSQTKTPSALELGTGAPVEGGEGARGTAKGGFSAFLEGLGSETAEAAVPSGIELAAGAGTGEEALSAVVPDEMAGAFAATGKNLPPVLPLLAAFTAGAGNVPGPETEGEGKVAHDPAADVQSEAATAIHAEGSAVAALVAPLLSDPLADGGRATAAERTASSGPQQHLLGQTAAVGRDAVPGSPAAPALVAQNARGETAPGPSIALHVAPAAEQAADRPSQREGESEGKGGGEPRHGTETATRLSRKAAPEFTPAQSMPGQTGPSAPTVVQSATGAERLPDGSQPTAAARPAIETQVTRELSRIVDSLASAREAFSAKTATLALAHGEFGELSLRFDQRRDGQLAVQLSAQDPEAHRAVAAAVAERPAFAQSESGGASSQQQGHGTGGSARGAAAERDANGPGGNSARQDRNEQQRGQARADTNTAGGNTRSGIFA